MFSGLLVFLSVAICKTLLLRPDEFEVDLFKMTLYRESLVERNPNTLSIESQREMDEAVAKVLERIRKYRLEKDLSIIELANRAKVSRSYVFYVESGRKIPSLTTLHKFAVAMDLSMKDFFE